MKRAILSVLLGLLGLGVLFTSMALAAPDQSLSSMAEPVAMFPATITSTDELTPTEELTPTTTQTHPVAAAIATHFSGVFTGTTAAGIMALHEQGFGFGVIAKAYFAAHMLGLADPMELLNEFSAGTGWGQIMKNHGLHPGQGRGNNLGAIMSGHAGDETLDAEGGRIPPGQLKKGGDGSGPSDQSANNGHGNGKDKGNNGKGKNK